MLTYSELIWIGVVADFIAYFLTPLKSRVKWHWAFRLIPGMGFYMLLYWMAVDAWDFDL